MCTLHMCEFESVDIKTAINIDAEGSLRAYVVFLSLFRWIHVIFRLRLHRKFLRVNNVQLLDFRVQTT